MSVEVIKKGKTKYYRIHCSECCSELGYTKADEVEEFDAWHNKYYIHCPVCGLKILTTYMTSNGNPIHMGVPTVEYE